MPLANSFKEVLALVDADGAKALAVLVRAAIVNRNLVMLSVECMVGR